MHGVQAMAVSLCVGPIGGENHSDYGPAARVALRVADWIADHPLPRGVIYNLNVPSIPYEALKGIRPATLAPVYLGEVDYDVLEDEGGACYRLRNNEPVPMDDPEYDTCKNSQGYATLTKLTWDFRLNADDSELGRIEI